MKYINGINRKQLCLFNDCLDDLIDEDNIVRFIDEYVEKIDFDNLEIKTIINKKGRPPYHPRLYLKIYIYSYLIKIRSSRKIENECKRNIEMIWLTEQLAPDHWSISNFRKQNGKVLTNMFKEFLKFCHQIELLDLKLAAIDGTKMRGQNHVGNIFKKEEMDKLSKRIESKINEYLEELENNDKEESHEYSFLNKDLKKKSKILNAIKEKSPS
jgi:transposase